MALRKINGALIMKARGDRSQADVVEAANGAFTEASLSAWELDKWRPRDEHVIALCKALECEWEDISVEVKQNGARKRSRK